MGFMDKAKKMAEQAQAKIDAAQTQFNERRRPEQQSDQAVEYDQHGRPIPQADPAPPHGDPLANPPTPGVPPTGQEEQPAPDPGAPAVPAAGVPPTSDAGDEAPPIDEPDTDRNDRSHAPPKLTGGDPLAG